MARLPLSCRHVMGVAGVLLGRDVGRLRLEAELAEPSHHPLLQFVLVQWRRGAHPLADQRRKRGPSPGTADPTRRHASRTPRRSTPPRTAAPGRPTKRCRRRAGGSPRSCRRRPARGRGCCSPGNTPSPPASCRAADPSTHRRAAGDRHTAASRLATRRDCDARSHAPVPAAHRRPGPGSTSAGSPTCRRDPVRRCALRSGWTHGSRRAASRRIPHPSGPAGRPRLAMTFVQYNVSLTDH